MKHALLLLITFICLLSSIKSADKEAWKSRTIYQVLTDRFSRGNGDNSKCNNLGNYCGGTFKGITQNLDYIKNMGFTAIWISPIVDNLDGGYHGYWARNWYQINSKFGSEQDFRDLVAALHAKGMWMMVDVVANHVAPVGFDFGQINPFNSNEHYHNACDINDWNN
jgi:alpha-amylase